MKLYRYAGRENRPQLGIEIEGKVVALTDVLRACGEIVPPEIEAADLVAMVSAGQAIAAQIASAVDRIAKAGGVKDMECAPADSLRLLAPIARPPKFICVGLNYRDHCEEQNVAPPKNPVIFAKFANAICGHQDVVRRPRVTAKLDFEGELAVVIGKGGRRIPAREALAHVFGYTIVNDVTARDIQKNDGQWLRAKSMDGFAPMGPCVVTAEDIPDPQQLSLRTTVNGAVMQDSHTSRMIFPVAVLIEFISQAITLEPGDIISTGTPAGVGDWRKPPVYLAAGDVVHIEIEKIGCLENTIAEEDA
jgi:2-keto-4-pentenoate hydratase/2-oxohepta-3-ene-1,7-dioic acid hydratase in catechol pathway